MYVCQAHARARFVLMRLLELEGGGMLSITECEPGRNLQLTLQKDKLATKGKQIIGIYICCVYNVVLYLNTEVIFYNNI